MNNKPNNNDNQGPQMPRAAGGSRMTLFIIICVAVFLLVLLMFSDNAFKPESMDYSVFKKWIENPDSRVERLERVELYHGGEINILATSGGKEIAYSTLMPPVEDTKLLPLLEDKGIPYTGRQNSPPFYMYLIQALPWAIMIFFIWFIVY